MIRLEPQVFDALTLLVKHHHRVVAKIELFHSAWGGRFAGDTALSGRIKAIRQALGDNGRLQRTIRTVRGRGYQFVGQPPRSRGGCLTGWKGVELGGARRNGRRPPLPPRNVVQSRPGPLPSGVVDAAEKILRSAHMNLETSIFMAWPVPDRKDR